MKNINSKGFRCYTTFSGSTKGEFDLGVRRLNDDDILNRAMTYVQQHSNDPDAWDIAMDMAEDMMAGKVITI